MTLNEILTCIFILLGAVIMFLSIIGTKQILHLVKGGKYVRHWRALFYLMMFFLVGYLAAVAFVFLGLTAVLILLTGMIFFFGALFVFLVSKVSHLTIDDLFATTVSKEYVENIVNTMADSLIVVNADSTIRTVNPSGLKLLGYKENELIGKSFGIILKDEKSRGKEKESSETSRDKTFLSKDRIKIPVSLSISIIYDSNRKVSGIIYVAQDITLRKQAENALKEKNREILEFTDTVTHDLKNPLGSIRNIFHVLKMNPSLSEDEKEAVALGNQAVDYMQELLEDLLASARLDAGSQELVLEEVEISELVKTIVNRYKPIIREKKITIETDVTGCIKADRKALAKVIMNLLGNAVNYIGVINV